MKKLSTFFCRMLKVGAIGFGGGSALIPVIENVFLKEEKLDTKKNYDKDVIVASITPGALPVEIAGSLGRRNFGRRGMIVGAVAMALPGAVGALLLFTILSAVQDKMLRGIKIASVGISAVIICILINYIGKVLKECKKESMDRLYKSIFVISVVCVLACGNNLYKLLGIDRTPLFAVPTVCILLAAFFVAFYTHTNYDKVHLLVTGVLCAVYFMGHGKAGLISTPWIIYLTEVMMVILALYGGVRSIRLTKWTGAVDKKSMLQDVGIWILFFAALSLPAWIAAHELLIPFLVRGFASAWMSFGGGDAYLTIADGLFVEGGIVSAENYYSSIVAVVNILPGSILCKTLLGIGYYVGFEAGGSVLTGILFGIAGFACSIAASCSSFGIMYYLYDSVANSKVFKVIGRWIRSIIAGLLVNIMLSLCNQNKAVQDYTDVSGTVIIGCTVGLVILDYFLERTGKVGRIWIFAINLAAVFLIMW